jgi:protein gp37
MGTEFKIDPELERFLPPLTVEERAQLEKNILSDPASVGTLVTWKEKSVLLDGHNRYAVCRKHKLPYKLRSISLADVNAAKLWMLRNNKGRRNLTDEQKSYYRGKEYELEKLREGRPNGKLPQRAVDTSRRLAQKHNVNHATIDRDAKFARSIDTIADKVGENAKDAILDRELKIGRQEVHKLADIAKAQPQAAKNVVRQIKAADKPEEVRKIVDDASRELRTKLNGDTSLFPIIKAEKVIAEVELKGGMGYIVRDPSSEPIFNRTNEMVDWASWTWNPVTGCWHGCDYCYARAIANDERMMKAYPNKFEPTFHEARLKAPANTPFPKVLERPADKNVFTCSMADLFGKWVPDEWIAKVFEQVTLNPQWNFLFLTKFPQRLRSVCDALKGFPENAWVGCTVDEQARVRTAQESFDGLEAKVRWLSVEPMQERLTFSDMSMFDWLVVGGKSASSFNGTPEGQPDWEWVEHLWQQARKWGLKIYWKENLKVKPKEVPW